MDKSFRIRLGVSFLVVALFCAAVIVRSGYLMLAPSRLLDETLAKQFRPAPKPVPRRGMILDRNREPLAVSLDVKSLYADPGKIRAKKGLARTLAKLLNISSVKLEAKLRQERDFVWVKRYLTKEEETRILDLLDEDRKLNLVLGFAKESKRFYPNMQLAAHILGFTGIDSNGLEGLEYFYDDELSGKKSGVDAIEGKNLVLTLDKGLQHTLENELQKGVDRAGAKAGNAIVMDADTGDIWAMASWPTYNPNDFRNSRPDSRRNRAVTEAFEPGSTIKTVLISGAIESNTVKPDTQFFCENGKFQIGERWIKESSTDKTWGWLTVQDIIKHSSNIGATKIGFKFGRENLYKWYIRQGLAAKTDIDLPGEAVGNFARPNTWSDVKFSNVSFGQGLTATSVQIIRTFAAIANGGFLVRPRLVSYLENAETQVQEKKPVKMIRTLKPQTARTISRMMTKVTEEDGTAVKAQIPGFEIAGKTGTAQVAENGVGYASGKYTASFVGFPVDVKPNLIALVVVTEPKFPNIFGGEVAAPVFQKVMSVALARAGVNPRVPIENNEMLLGKSELKSDKPSWEEQLAHEPGKTEIKDPIVGGVLDKLSALQEKEMGEYVMPNLIGSSARDVLDNFTEKSVHLRIQGAGVVVEQFPRPGQVFRKGESVSVKLDAAELVTR